MLGYLSTRRILSASTFATRYVCYHAVLVPIRYVSNNRWIFMIIALLFGVWFFFFCGVFFFSPQLLDFISSSFFSLTYGKSAEMHKRAPQEESLWSFDSDIIGSSMRVSLMAHFWWQLEPGEQIWNSAHKEKSQMLYKRYVCFIRQSTHSSTNDGERAHRTHAAT